MLVIAGLCGWIGHLNGANHTLALKIYNDSAALDTSRNLALSRKDSLRILGDSLAGVTKLALQQTQKSDALDKALGESRKVLVSMTLTIDSLRAVHVVSVAPVSIDTSNGQNIRRAMFHVERPIFTADLAVSLPAAGAGILDSLSVNVKPVKVGLRIGCQDKNANGIRPARVTAVGNKQVSIFIDHAEQDADVCQDHAGQRTSWLGVFLPSFAAGVGLGANPIPMIRGKAGEIQPSIWVGITLWHWPK